VIATSRTRGMADSRRVRSAATACTPSNEEPETRRRNWALLTLPNPLVKMIQCNFATMLGVEPAALSRWYWAGFTDAYERVELPNVAGMGTWGDGGALASKPYVASGAYVNRMSNYCGPCRYDVKQRTGPDACPMNFLYWDFMARHRERFAKHPRMRMMTKHLDGMADTELVQLRRQADEFRASLSYERET
jgi:deoxyribodipyrimidine photolyase-related protein